jgi:hypothetical protein
LVLSAGINANQYRETVDKIDSHFQINWLGQFYAVNLLYPLIRKTSKLPDTPAPRVVWESSELHRMSPSDVKFESKAEINNPNVGSEELYARTKLAIILSVEFGLVQKVIKPHHDNVYALNVHPGAVRYPSQQTSVRFLLATGRSTQQCNNNGKKLTPASSENSSQRP